VAHQRNAQPTPPRPMRRSRWPQLDVLFPATIVLAAIFLTAFRLSGSSIPIFSTSAKPAAQYIVTGQTRPIRSDEWLALSPLKIGRVRAGFPDERTYGMGTLELSHSWRPQLPSRSLGAALFSPFNLPLVVLPLDYGFALSWWLPFFTCLLGLYAWFRAMRIEPGVALVGALLATTAPAMVWWTAVGSSLAQIFTAAAVPSALVIAGARIYGRRPRLALLAALAAGLAAASLPWFYTPWVIPTALFVAGVTFLWGLSESEHRRAFLVVVSMALGIFVMEELVYLLHERSYYEALASTVYPGARRFTGGGMKVGLLFSSLFPFTLASDRGVQLVGTNLSEVSMGWTVAAPAAIAVAFLGRKALNRGERILMLGAVLLMIVLGSWCLIPWPGLFASLTFFDRISPARLAPLLGFFGVVCLALLFGTADRRARLMKNLGTIGAVLVTASAALIAAWGAMSFRRDFFPVLSQRRLWFSVICLTIVIASLFVRWRAIVVGIATIVAVVSGLVVNPLSQGLGALDRSSPAALVRQIDTRLVAPSHGAWAAEDLYVDGLLNGEGVNSLSSFNDPVVAHAWRILDPRPRDEKAWNRLGYIRFAWKSGLNAPLIENPQGDVIQVSVDPCDGRLTRLKLRVIVSNENLVAPCLSRLNQFRWMGRTFLIYQRLKSSSITRIVTSATG
jgi:hypothetical protein